VNDLVSVRNLSVATAIVVFLLTLKGAIPAFFEKVWVRRVMPVMPVLLGVAAAFTGFAEIVAPPTWQNKLVIGVLTGAAAATFYKVGRTSILGQGIAPYEPEPLLRNTSIPADPSAGPQTNPSGGA